MMKLLPWPLAIAGILLARSDNVFVAIFSGGLICLAICVAQAAGP